MSDSGQPHRRQPTRLLHPWDSPGKNTGVGCHFLFHRVSYQPLKWSHLNDILPLIFNYCFDTTYSLYHLEMHSNSVEDLWVPSLSFWRRSKLSTISNSYQVVQAFSPVFGTQPGSPSVQHSYEYTHWSLKVAPQSGKAIFLLIPKCFCVNNATDWIMSPPKKYILNLLPSM